MGHSESWKSTGQLEDDLEYDIGRMEEFEADVRKLAFKNKELHETNWGNAKEFVDTKVEMADLERFIEI